MRTLAVFVAAFALLFAMAGSMLAAQPSLDAPEVVTFGDEFEVTLTGDHRSSLWARLDCTDGSEIVWTSFERMDDSEADFFQSGPTPSYDGSFAVECTVNLFAVDDRNIWHLIRNAADTFQLVPA